MNSLLQLGSDLTEIILKQKMAEKRLIKTKVSKKLDIELNLLEKQFLIKSKINHSKDDYSVQIDSKDLDTWIQDSFYNSINKIQNEFNLSDIDFFIDSDFLKKRFYDRCKSIENEAIQNRIESDLITYIDDFCDSVSSNGYNGINLQDNLNFIDSLGFNLKRKDELKSRFLRQYENSQIDYILKTDFKGALDNKYEVINSLPDYKKKKFFLNSRYEQEKLNTDLQKN